MTTPLTPGRAIAWAAIFDAHEHRLPHWSEWSADLRAWADAQSETPCQDTNNEAEQGILRGETEAVPEVRKHQGDLTASPRPIEPGGVGL